MCDEKRALKRLIKEHIRQESTLSKIFNGLPLEDRYQRYIEGSTYIVPPNTLLAYQYIDGKNIPVVDQTVWVIDKYNNGYFFGKVFASLNAKPLSEFNLSGTVTPFGDVYITFLSLDNKNTIITGVGKFIITRCGGYFIMQMNSAQSATFGLSHWSYMVSVTPKDYWYQYLPGVNISVPTYINEF